MSREFTSRQRNEGEKLFGDVIRSLDPAPSQEEFQERVIRSKRLQPLLREVLVKLLARYFIPFTDEEAMIWLMEQAQQSEPDAKRLVEGCRKGALERGLANSVPCHWSVEEGATLKQTIPTIGPCVEDFKYLRNWSFVDVPTEQCLVSGVPIALRETTSQNLATQLQTLAVIEQRWGIAGGFFSKELIPTVYTAGVALTHHNVTKQQMFGDLWVRTGTCDAGGFRLSLCWDRGRLDCGFWYWVDGSYPNLAVAPLGVTKALER